MVTVNGWAFHGDGTASPADDDGDVTVWVEGGALRVSDDTQYYPSGAYRIPLWVVDRLRDEAKEAP